MTKYWFTGLLAFSMIAGLLASLTPESASAQKNTAVPVTALAAIVLPGTKSAPTQYGVYLGHGLILTNWHPWTLDGQDYTAAAPRIAADRRITTYDADGIDDPGETLLATALCGTEWVSLAASDAACEPFASISGAGVIFPAAGDTLDATPIPLTTLLYASREHDIALFSVDAAAVAARGVAAAQLSMAIPDTAQTLTVLGLTADGSISLHAAALTTATAARLPEPTAIRDTGPWRVPSLVLDASEVLAEGGPVFDTDTGVLLGLSWRSGTNTAETWITPTSEWIHALYAANAAIADPALAAVLDETLTAPVTAASTLDDPLMPTLGNAGIDVQHIDLALSIDPTTGTLSGTATLTIQATAHRLNTFSLDAYDLAVTRVTVDGSETGFIAKSHKLVIDLPEPVDFGTRFAVAIDYSATPQPYRSVTVPFFDIGMLFENAQVATLNEPDGAHTWFPCNDHPRDRATYDIRLTVAAPLVAVSNGTLIDSTTDSITDSATATYHWQMAQPMASYLVVVAVADYVSVTQSPAEDAVGDNNPAITHYVYAGQEQQAQQVFSYTDDAITLFEQFFGPYPFDRYGHVIVPEQGMALETQTLTTMPDVMLDGSELGAFNLVVHELAHQWFGNTVALAAWSDIWLNEGFATFAEWLATEQRFGADTALAARSASEQALISDGRSTPLIDPAPDELLSLGSYHKGAWVLFMLRDELGEETFYTLLQTYVQTFAETPVTSLDFWRLAEEVSGRDLAPFFEQWLLQGGVPRYTLYWTETATGAETLLCPQAASHYDLTLTLRFADGVRELDTTVTTAPEAAPETVRAAHTLPFTPTSIEVDPEQRILAQVEIQPISALPDTCE